MLKSKKTFFFIVSLLTLLGIIIIIFADNIKNHTASSLLTELGIAVFIMSTVTMLMELGFFTDYFIGKLTDVIISDEYIKKLSDEDIKELKDKLNEKLYFKNINNNPNNYFQFVENEVASLLDGYYYEEYDIHVECYFNHDYILKRITKRTTIVNPIKNSDNPITVTIPFGAEMKPIDNVSNNSLFQIKSIEFVFADCPNESMDEVTLEPEKIKDRQKNDIVVFNYNLNVNIKERCVVKSIIETIAPLSDMVFSNKLSRPTKRYNAAFYVYDRAYKVNAHSFGFLDNSQKKEEEKIKDKFSYDVYHQGAEIKYSNWLLPGNGVVFVMSKTNSKE